MRIGTWNVQCETYRTSGLWKLTAELMKARLDVVAIQKSGYDKDVQNTRFRGYALHALQCIVRVMVWAQNNNTLVRFIKFQLFISNNHSRRDTVVYRIFFSILHPITFVTTPVCV